MSTAGRTLHAACPLCASPDASEYARHATVLWVRCTCGLIYKKWTAEQVPPPRPFDPASTAYSRRWRHRVAKSREQIRDVLNHVAPGPLLDIGCSLGYTLRAAQELGMAATGLEYDAGVAAFCRGKGYTVEVGSMSAMPFADGAFQIVIMKHVLEHTPDPRAALREVRRVLRPGGGLYIAVPFGGYHRSVSEPAHHKFFQPSDPTTGHAIYYTPATLSRLLAEEGYRVARVHPHLVHRSAGVARGLVQRLTAPLRWSIERLRDAAAIRKEFWLVAVRADA
ncbi:MAG TPA: methyltransferase domain-containing protein [Steroidobacteraceae bacterium]|nr:methyltransferase domain-containing protein [Steroidobacteraceae bacterium]